MISYTLIYLAQSITFFPQLGDILAPRICSSSSFNWIVLGHNAVIHNRNISSTKYCFSWHSNLHSIFLSQGKSARKIASSRSLRGFLNTHFLSFLGAVTFNSPWIQNWIIFIITSPSRHALSIFRFWELNSLWRKSRQSLIPYSYGITRSEVDIVRKSKMVSIVLPFVYTLCSCVLLKMNSAYCIFIYITIYNFCLFFTLNCK